ncbi:Ger(x)C family spore germination protein [Paenibacillus sacheonensis]|uniref:Ger(X)C family spore germination protein n=1 Tax=Paenibacillus sacheonensis TaxID=742054 RepID=A0A7X5BWM2_9BACL|nr:Ger(x)C family spore germination protein [Paenibacillus sacheonensis]MBM7564266.1 Ger(x)C family germination protein [Paenibacillus sacheonensis]NBC67411.1 Ger(x)C family spore germination protein [Paenibacillus sacheonensis]
MMKRFAGLALTIMGLSAVLTGCWDTQYVTNKKLINGFSLDAAEGQGMLGSVRTVVLENKGGGQFDVKDEFMKAAGDSTSTIGMKIDSMLPGTIEASKTHVIIIGEKLAKQGIAAPLEPIFRSPKGYLKAKVLVSEGTAADVLASKQIDHNPIAFGIKQIVEGAALSTSVPKQTVYSIWNQISDPGDDALLPLIRIVDRKTLIVDGIALFDGDKYSGISLFREDAKILMLLSGRIGRLVNLGIPVQEQTITFAGSRLKRSMKVTVNPKTNTIECVIKADLYGSLNSYPSHLNASVDRARLEKAIDAWFDAHGKKVAGAMLRANCDAFGIGRRLRAHHSGLWRKLDWNEAYRGVIIKPEFHVHLKNTGVIR